MKSSPINALQLEVGDPPLVLRRQYLSDRFFFRCLQLSDHPLIQKLSQLYIFISSSSYWKHKKPPCLIQSYEKYKSIESPTFTSSCFPIYKCSYQSLVLSPNIKYDFGLSKNDSELNAKFMFITDIEWNEWHYIFTDASKPDNSGCVGVGVFHSQFNIVQKIKLPPESSVFTGECYGILKAVEYILLMKLHKAIVFTDSMSSLQALAKYPFKSKPVYPIICDIRQSLYLCMLRGYSVSFAWLPGHSGISGNDKADLIAREAVTCGDMYPYHNYCSDLACLPKIYLSLERPQQLL
ncbi:uncharacterized protein LOC128202569 [Galleria mellonella]|uniref:Uncharacterized protein LOC128202569 n=1 Tax=Galleria mellonella TaxID=7137 RepID=A0ABM3N6U1_GALME|nr:uncharacterized protein LOC128202569 [Galleria mellonella]